MRCHQSKEMQRRKAPVREGWSGIWDKNPDRLWTVHGNGISSGRLQGIIPRYMQAHALCNPIISKRRRVGPARGTKPTNSSRRSSWSPVGRSLAEVSCKNALQVDENHLPKNHRPKNRRRQKANLWRTIAQRKLCAPKSRGARSQERNQEAQALMAARGDLDREKTTASRQSEK